MSENDKQLMDGSRAVCMVCMWELDAVGQGKVIAFKNEKMTKGVVTRDTYKAALIKWLAL